MIVRAAHRDGSRSTRSSPSARRCSPGGLRSWPRRSTELNVERIDPVGGALRLGRALRPARPDDRRRTCAHVTVERFLDRYRIDRAARAARRGAGRGALSSRAAKAGPGAGAAARMGRAAARDRHVGVAHRLSQARRLHPAERRHARILGRRAEPARAARVRLPRRTREECEPMLGDRRRCARNCSRCGSPCCFITRDAAIALPRMQLRVAPAHRAARCPRAGSPRIRLTAHLLDKERAQWARARLSVETLPAKSAGVPRRNPGRSRPSAPPPSTPSRTRLDSHHTAPLRTLQDASLPDSRNDATSPSVGWWPTTSTGSRASGQPGAARTSPIAAPGASSGTVLNLRFSASAVCCARSAGLTSMRHVSGRCPSSHAAMRSACLSPLAVSRRPRSGSPGSASAWRHRIRSIARVALRIGLGLGRRAGPRSSCCAKKAARGPCGLGCAYSSPSASSSHASRLSARYGLRPSSITRALSSASSTGKATSMRRNRLRPIQSALAR